MNQATFKIPAVEKTVTVSLAQAAAFERFTRQITSWWPLAKFSIGNNAAATVAFEPLATGGKLVEHWPTGEAHVWGTITVFEPPARLSFTWHVGKSEDTAQLIEVFFSPDGTGSTLVRLVHTGWERLGEAAQETRDSYDRGWIFVLDCFAATS
jgi:uncharacterized protein YndB with AHSA1/START domain